MATAHTIRLSRSPTLTVTLEERTQSSKKADTSMGKSSGIEIPAPTIGGRLETDWSLSGNVDRDFNGSASTSQQNTLSGYITVTVAEVLPNGVLRDSLTEMVLPPPA